jgi:hypothetical protein
MEAIRNAARTGGLKGGKYGFELRYERNISVAQTLQSAPPQLQLQRRQRCGGVSGHGDLRGRPRAKLAS